MVEAVKTAEIQQQIASVLERITAKRTIQEDSTELLSEPGYQEARQELLEMVYSFPENVRCLTIDIEIPPCPETPVQEIDYLNRALRRLIEPLETLASDRTKPVKISLTVKTPQLPETEANSFGSQARQLSSQVVETVRLGEKSGIALLEINPLGSSAASTSITRNRNALIFLVPLRFVQSITLQAEEKPLTPYFKYDSKNEMLVPYEVKYL